MPILARNQKPARDSQELYAARTLAQVWLLMEHLSALRDRQLSELKINYKGADLQGATLLDKIHQISDKFSKPAHEVTIEDRVVLQLSRDALSGRQASDRTDGRLHGARPPTVFSRGASNRSILAYDAYPDLGFQARMHKVSRLTLLLLALTLISIVVWLSTEVAIGKHLLQTVGDRRARQATIAQEEQQIETALDKSQDKPVEVADFSTGIPTSTVRLCDRAYLYALRARQTHAEIPKNVDGEEIQLRSPSESAVCGQDETLSKDFQVAHRDIDAWLRDWPSLVGGPLGWIGSEIPAAHPPQSDTPSPTSMSNNIELHVAPRVLAIGNYFLPVVFGTIGSLIYVLMEFSAKVRDNLLEPRDGWLS
jgi:heme exporter protein D